MEIVKDILKKKELKSLDYEFVAEKVKEFVDDLEKIKNKRSKEYKEALKKVRAHLREIYGVFILKDYDKKEKYLLELEKARGEKRLGLVNKILSLHQSTKERLNYYDYVYKKIFSVTGNPKRILDLGCGLNPCSYSYLGCKPEYLASDLSAEDCAFLNTFFDIMKIDGKAFPFDLLKFHLTKLLKYVKVDVCFLFKVVDPIESQKRNFTEYLLKNLPCKWFAVSFSTKSLGGKNTIRKERRAWFEKLLKKLKYTFKTFEVSNEMFFVVKK